MGIQLSPWGSLFGPRCGRRFSAPPLRTLRRWAVALPRHRRFRLGVSVLRSRPFARSGRREIDRAIRTASFGRARPGAPLTDAFSAPRMRTTLGLYGPSSCVYRIASTSDVLVVTLRHARAGLFAVRCASRVRSSRIVTAVNLGAEGPPLRAARKSYAGEGPKTPSVVSRTSEPKPACRFMRQRLNESACHAHRFAFSRPVPRVRRSFELPSG